MAPSPSAAWSMFCAMIVSACDDCVPGSSWFIATFIAARTSGGRSVEVRTIRERTLSKNDDGIGRSYLSPLSRAEWVRVRPPFKPCMRISRTRLTRWSSGRGMRHLRILNRAAQAKESQGFEEGTPPRRRLRCHQTGPRTLQEQPAEALFDILVDVREVVRRVAGAKVLRPTAEHRVHIRNDDAEVRVTPRPAGQGSDPRPYPRH